MFRGGFKKKLVSCSRRAYEVQRETEDSDCVNPGPGPG